MNQTILGIDIGSSKICSLIAEIKNGNPNIIGMGVQHAKGIRKGAITNIEQASRSIKESVNDAKRIAGTNISQAIISLSGVYTKNVDSYGIANIPHNEIGLQEINRVMIQALYNAEIPNNYEIIHVLPYQFKVDDREYIDDPFGMSGNVLGVSVHIVIAQKSGLENLKKAVRNAGVEITGIVLNAYASSIAVLTNEEKELGVACIDMGANSCDIMIHHGRSMRYDDFLGVGSGHITNDIVVALNTPPKAADNIKIEYATLHTLTQEELGYTLEIPSIGVNDTRVVSLEILHSVVFSRVLETLQIIEKSIERSELKNNLGAGVVITGGMAYMKGLRELASSVFVNLPVRTTGAKDISDSFDTLKDPAYATVVGLILYGSGRYTNYELDANKKLKHNQQNRSPENSNLVDLEMKEDVIDLAIKDESKNDMKENNIDIKLDKGKSEGHFHKLVKWAKGLF